MLKRNLEWEIRERCSPSYEVIPSWFRFLAIVCFFPCVDLLAFGLFLTMANKKKKSGSHRSQLKQQASQLINDRSVLASEAPPLPHTVHVTVPPNSNSPHKLPAVVPTTVLVHDSPNHGEHSPSINHIFVKNIKKEEANKVLWS